MTEYSLGAVDWVREHLELTACKSDFNNDDIHELPDITFDIV
jgi:hypothetical protein